MIKYIGSKRALLAEIPQAHFVYLADGAHAPYGERSPQQIAERAHRITEGLRHHFGIDALVVACNTATALAIEGLRAEHADWPIVGVEPALKPAAALTRTGHVGVMATRGTVESERYSRLRQRLESGSDSPLHFSSQACDGLADAIERAKSTDRAAIIDALTKSTFSNHIMPYGATQFVNGQNMGAQPLMTQVVKGDIKVIVPRDYREVEPIFPLNA